MTEPELNISQDKKPMIAELEAMLDDSSRDYAIEIQPDGSIRAVEGEPNNATPEIHTLEEVLGPGNGNGETEEEEGEAPEEEPEEEEDPEEEQ